MSARDIEQCGMADLADAYGKLAKAAERAQTACTAGLDAPLEDGAIEESLELVSWRWERLRRARQGYPSLEVERIHREMYGPQPL